jgi:hypothetical protein
LVYIGWAMDSVKTSALGERALCMAYILRGGGPDGVVFHADRGTQYTTAQLNNVCNGLGIKQSVVPCAVAAVAAVPLPNCLPRTEIGWHVTPGDPAPIPVNDALNHPSVVPEGTPLTARRRRQQRLNTGPLTISQNRSTRHTLSISNEHPEV